MSLADIIVFAFILTMKENCSWAARLSKKGLQEVRLSLERVQHLTWVVDQPMPYPREVIAYVGDLPTTGLTTTSNFPAAHSAWTFSRP